MSATKSKRHRQRYAIAYFSSEIDADANADMKLEKNFDNDETLISCRTRNGIEWRGRRDSQLLALTRLVLVIRHRRTGKVKVVPGVDAFRFVPVARQTAAARRATLANGTPSRSEKRAANQALYEEFGTSAKKRRIAEGKRLNASMTTQEAKDAAAKSARRLERSQQQQQQELSPQAPAAALLPPFDPTAVEPDGIFAFDSLCPPDVKSSLLPEAERLSKATREQLAEWRDAGELCELVASRLARAPTEPAARLRYCTLLAMLAVMRKFHALGFRGVNKKNPLPEVHDTVVQHLLDNFTLQLRLDPDLGTPGRNRSLPPQMKDKLLIHMLILCLMLDGFSTELQGLQQELRMSKERLRKLALTIGCEMATEKIGSAACRVVRLKAPLKLPSK